MKVQIITDRKNSESYGANGIIYSTFDSPKLLDEFDIDVIDLSGEKTWYNNGSDTKQVNRQNDFKSIREMVVRKTRAKIVYVFPMNGQFCFDYGPSFTSKNKTYNKSVLIKDKLLSIYGNIISCILPTNNYTIKLNAVFEPTDTTVASQTFSADFFFEEVHTILTKSNYGEKPTTVKIADNDIYLTSLNIASSGSDLSVFLNFLFGQNERSKAPEWMSNEEFDDDNEQNRIIETSLETIRSEKAKIEAAKEILRKNAEYKSILYTNGNELVSVVFSILQQLLNCDLSTFVDEKKEDFLIKKESFTFIGEIKGVTSNIKNEHIAQVENHYQGYMDKLIEEKSEENVHQLLIVNPFRTKPIAERDPVDQRQIDLAVRYGCLLIETNTLLRIFEKFRRNEITTEQCISVFGTTTGLLRISDFDRFK